jgi:tetratricopeptide (TPR) repeat protein
MKRTGKTFFLSFLFFLVVVPAQSQFNTLLKKANKQYELRAFNLAVETFLEALEIRPNDPESLTKLGDSFRHLNQMDKAALAYGKVADREDFPTEHMLNYGFVLKALGRYQDAKEQFLKFARSVPDVGTHFARTCDFALLNLNPDPQYQVVPTSVNSADSDFGVAFTDEGIVFSSFRMNMNRSPADWSGKAEDHLYLSRVNPSGSLEPPALLRPNEPDAHNNGPVTFAPNMQAVAYTRNNFVNGTRQIPSAGMKLDLFLSQLEDKATWKNEFAFPFNGAQYSTGFPAFSSDGRTLYFASDRPGGKGGFDIWETVWNGSSFNPPRPLSAVNTPGNEIAPFTDGTYLYFSSDYHEGFGGYDVFQASRTGSGWGSPKNLMLPVNSPYDDYGYVYSLEDQVGLFTSNRPGGAGMEDIYAVFSSNTGMALQVVNGANGQPIPGATLDFRSCNQGTYTTNPSGQFVLRSQSNMNCELEARAPGFLSQRLSLSSLSGGGVNQPSTIYLIRNGEMAEGKVTDIYTQAPLPGVLVEITNLQTQSKMTALTDQLGIYRAALQPNGQYNIQMSRTGYQDASRQIQVGSRLDPSLLGTVALLGSTNTGAQARNTSSGAFTLDNQQAEPQADGFAIQVAALRSSNTDKFRDLERLGTVYTVQQGNLYKVRVGVYTTRAEAERVLQEVKKIGYSRAYIVNETSSPSPQPYSSSPQTRSSNTGAFGLPATPESSTPPPASYNQNTQSGKPGRYHIQLAAYSNALNFDPKGLENLGRITQFERGGYTIFFISSFDSLNDARNALRRAQDVGFQTAYIVEYLGDKEFRRVY